MSALSTKRIFSGASAEPNSGNVHWVASKSIWVFAMTVIALTAGPLTLTPGAFLVFIFLTAVTICLGHSVGMHRLLLHRSFQAPKWLEYCLVYLGTLVGMAGPFGMMHAHDMYDWAQRQQTCHDFFAHRRPFFHDAFWQMHCAIKLDHPPSFIIEAEVKDDPYFRFLEKTWMMQQLPLAAILFLAGGISWVVWGVAVRVAISLTGFWMIGHLAHRNGHQGWSIDDVAVQGYNLPAFGLVSFGESYHGNHHAFPDSARLGLEAGQFDPGWQFIRLLQAVGLAWRVKLPSNLVEREGLRRLSAPMVQSGQPVDHNAKGSLDNSAPQHSGHHLSAE